ncbi:MAG: DNA gyrase inhibitor YacG [Gammaproteobacteria bacterium]|nr:DNA gyrase inhibitor YacG [Gammaproteobacteria bacterium]MDH3767077.1 DNA gyrase inhibitor YacG [Gammaproteobacteria bacterium]
MQVNCPNCRKSVEWSQESVWRPFCSNRCRLIDLGAWFNEEHRITDESDPAASQSPDIDEQEHT